MDHSPNTARFRSLLDDTSTGAIDCLTDIGLRTWPPGGVHQTEDDGRIHLFYVLEGIVCCARRDYLTRILPRELLRVGQSEQRVLENPSRTDSTLAIHMALQPVDDTPTSTRHHYFSDDLKDNQLCRVAAFTKDGVTLATRCPVDIYLSTLGRYDTLMLERKADQPLLVLCVRGEASVNSKGVCAGDNALSIVAESATIVGTKPCTLLTLRGAESNDDTVRSRA